jgi:hypothetical protein
MKNKHTPISTVVLKSCPFCGVKPKIKEVNFHITPTDTPTKWIECDNKKCLIQPSTFLRSSQYGDSLSISIKRWNKRVKR